MAMDGKTIRLRASCNACNESKVRCSQRKPTCARCERNGTECIYGLSRRTHKDAPPISMPSSASQRPRGPSRSSSYSDMKKTSSNKNNTNGNTNGNSNGNWRGLSFPKSGTATPSTSTSNASPERSAGTHDATLFDDYMSPAGAHFMIPPHQQSNATATAATPQFHLYTHTPHAPTPTAADPSHGAGLPLLDFGSLDVVTGTTGASSSTVGGGGGLDDPLSAAVTRFPTPGAEYAHHPWATDMDMDSFWTRQVTSMTAPPSPPPTTTGPYGECTCHAGVTELLASMRGGAGDDRRLSPDAQLAKLKRCIASSEASMGCAHIREDAEPIHIMSVATLIGYVINEFEMLAAETQLRRLSPSAAAAAAAAIAGSEMTGLVGNTETGSSSLSSGSDESMSGMVTQITSMTPGVKPRLSWGVLELEDDDEVDLRQRLYLLSFRKLERLLSQLTLYLRSLHDARAGLPDPSRHMAFVMACDYTRLWLEKKAEDVKRLFSITVGDETVDPSLV